MDNPPFPEPAGQHTNAVRWLQKLTQEKASRLPYAFETLADWEVFRQQIRRELPQRIGLPSFPPLKESACRSRFAVGQDVLCERIDIYVDEHYAIPAFVFVPAEPKGPSPAFVWSPGYNEGKWITAYQTFAVRMAKQGFIVLILDHAPFGETTPYQMDDKMTFGMTVVMSISAVLGISQIGMRAAETMRAGEYLRARADVQPDRVAVAGLCQGGMDTWLAAALDDGFCAAAPFCSASTFRNNVLELSSYHALSDSSPYPFAILDICDVDHLHAAIAPRPLLVRANLPDHWWPVSGLGQIEQMTKQVYHLYQAENCLDIRAEVHEHNLTGPFADQLETFLLEWVAR
jgi:dienelactone hydrolase